MGSQNHKMVKVGGDQTGSAGPSLYNNTGHACVLAILVDQRFTTKLE